MIAEIKTRHSILLGRAQEMNGIKDHSVHLVVTSPPYPMIEMWDVVMVNQNQEIHIALEENGQLAFELMHKELDRVWAEINRVLIPGGFVCINIGDAARTIKNEFALFSNHSRIISAFLALGFSNLPNIIWRKQTNAPNKFMGSGMLPAGAYVTLEHEWILIFRKGGKRVFIDEAEKQLRKASAFFWEERNLWFADLWDLKGTRQKINGSDSRSRSAAFPFEIPYRLINMYSVKGDMVLDPFLGIGTSTLAAIVAERNSTGIEIDSNLIPLIFDRIGNADLRQLNELIIERIHQHEIFVTERVKDPAKNDIKHFNLNFNLPVVTSQEINMVLPHIRQIDQDGDGSFIASYSTLNSLHRSPLPYSSSGSIPVIPCPDPPQ